MHDWPLFWSALTAIGTVAAAVVGVGGYILVHRERIQQQRADMGLALRSLWFQCTLLQSSLEVSLDAPSTYPTPWTALDRAQPYLDQTDEVICRAVRELYRALQYRDIRVQRYLSRSEQIAPRPEGIWAKNLHDINAAVSAHVDYVSALLGNYIVSHYGRTLARLDVLSPIAGPPVSPGRWVPPSEPIPPKIDGLAIARANEGLNRTSPFGS